MNAERREKESGTSGKGQKNGRWESYCNKAYMYKKDMLHTNSHLFSLEIKCRR